MFLETAIQAAQKSGQILMEHFGKLKKDQIQIKSSCDYVTEIDKLSEKELLKIIKNKFPDHSILAEESGEETHQSDYCWIVDPLDGTTNYIHQFPHFSVSIALEYKGERKIGVVLDPVRNELFYAEKGEGAFLNEKQIHVSPNKSLKHALIATGFPFHIHDRLDKYLKTFRSIFFDVSGIRRAGSAALDLAYTACGRFEGFWELGLSVWDIAGGATIVEEAGGIVTGFDGKKELPASGDIICGSPEIHQLLLDKITESFK